MRKLRAHVGVATLFHTISWLDFLNLCDRTYEEPTLEFLSTFAKDEEAKFLTFQL